MTHVADAQIGINYRVTTLDMNNSNLKHRLRALGCIEGCLLQVHQKGLFKGPCTININGQHISIRHCDACKICLEHCYE
ncbi:FeoA family protein [Staphylococcus chromogenes]|uniref:FeoA family protein n=1 Tax=Staphylococcus chromogenes TaxID=46126 RepID=UPI00288798E5|nr:FeoA domain-containing protein [Staphylococcus chromogenes]MDT0655258.1 FeoA domain-containing protein [Staphylococcus chromogenes]